jgi:hypothetical protein
VRDVLIDSRTKIVPDGVRWRVEQTDDVRKSSRWRRSECSHATQADALRAVLSDAVRFGQWRAA